MYIHVIKLNDMNTEIMKQIKDTWGIDVEFYPEPGNEGYFFTNEDGHSEWDLEGNLTYSEHF
jgi:hypothetical protein